MTGQRCEQCTNEVTLGLTGGRPAGYGVSAPLYVPDCNGFVAPGCTAPFYLANSVAIAAGGTKEMAIGVYQPLQLVGIVNDSINVFNPGDVEIIDIKFNGKTIRSTAESRTGDLRDIVGDLIRYTDNSAFAGTNPTPSNIPLSDNTNQLSLIVRNNLAVAIAIGVVRLELHMRAPTLQECMVCDIKSAGAHPELAIERAVAAMVAIANGPQPTGAG